MTDSNSESKSKGKGEGPAMRLSGIGRKSTPLPRPPAELQAIQAQLGRAMQTPCPVRKRVTLAPTCTIAERCTTAEHRPRASMEMETRMRTRNVSRTGRPAPAVAPTMIDADRRRPQKPSTEAQHLHDAHRTQQVIRNTLAGFGDFAPQILDALSKQIQQNHTEQDVNLRRYLGALSDTITTNSEARHAKLDVQLHAIQGTVAQHQATTKQRLETMVNALTQNAETLSEHLDANAALRHKYTARRLDAVDAAQAKQADGMDKVHGSVAHIAAQGEAVGVKCKAINDKVTAIDGKVNNLITYVNANMTSNTAIHGKLDALVAHANDKTTSNSAINGTLNRIRGDTQALTKQVNQGRNTVLTISQEVHEIAHTLATTWATNHININGKIDSLHQSMNGRINQLENMISWRLNQMDNPTERITTVVKDEVGRLRRQMSEDREALLKKIAELDRQRQYSARSQPVSRHGGFDVQPADNDERHFDQRVEQIENQPTNLRGDFTAPNPRGQGAQSSAGVRKAQDLESPIRNLEQNRSGATTHSQDVQDVQNELNAVREDRDRVQDKLEEACEERDLHVDAEARAVSAATHARNLAAVHVDIANHAYKYEAVARGEAEKLYIAALKKLEEVMAADTGAPVVHDPTMSLNTQLLITQDHNTILTEQNEQLLSEYYRTLNDLQDAKGTAILNGDAKDAAVKHLQIIEDSAATQHRVDADHTQSRRHEIKELRSEHDQTLQELRSAREGAALAGDSKAALEDRLDQSNRSATARQEIMADRWELLEGRSEVLRKEHEQTLRQLNDATAHTALAGDSAAALAARLDQSECSATAQRDITTSQLSVLSTQISNLCSDFDQNSLQLREARAAAALSQDTTCALQDHLYHVQPGAATQVDTTTSDAEASPASSEYAVRNECIETAHDASSFNDLIHRIDVARAEGAKQTLARDKRDLERRTDAESERASVMQEQGRGMRNTLVGIWDYVTGWGRKHGKAQDGEQVLEEVKRLVGGELGTGKALEHLADDEDDLWA